ncbi:hypothetical protein QJS04_geneDACA004215 [Acorus gramineus]|uniref:Uncharacterized protein n=1 Tax=Acorus gramineus TaxID=55184 RepID=A0AAV9B4R5_ACOGR|nr:hypothetical protein QJS04_geneDACA004215 [Acorus gramineus]
MGDSFHRESSVGHDLGVLSASPLHLLDAIVLSLRYFSHASATFVWANEDHGGLIANLSRATRPMRSRLRRRGGGGATEAGHH